MELETVQFGKINYIQQDTITFKSGIFGFEHLQEYLILDDVEPQPFRWLQSTKESEVCFPLLDPFLFIADYKDQLPKYLQNETETKSILVITTLKNKDGRMTINLKGPILLDDKEKIGQQVILNSDDISTSHILN